jgi:hypothetical protein
MRHASLPREYLNTGTDLLLEDTSEEDEKFGQSWVEIRPIRQATAVETARIEAAVRPGPMMIDQPVDPAFCRAS